MIAYRLPPADSPPKTYAVSASFVCSAKLNKLGVMGVELRRPIMRNMAQEVAERYGLTLEQLRGPQRCRAISRPRQELMYELYATGRFSLPQIGRFLGNRDHQTVIHGCRRHAERNGLPHVVGAR